MPRRARIVFALRAATVVRTATRLTIKRRSVAYPLANDVAGRVDVVPHLRTVVFPLAGVVPPVGTFIPPL